jgi:prevent-host-death family protein
MLHVDLDNILTHDELASKAEEVLRKSDEEGKIVVITRNGRPAVAVLKLEQLEELSGRTVSTNTPPHEFPGVIHDAPAQTEEHHEVQSPPMVSDMPTMSPVEDHDNHDSGLPDMP